MKVEISKGFDESERPIAAALFWQAFSRKLTRIMGRGTRAQAFFAATLSPDFALVARDDAGNVLGLAGYKTDKGAFAGGGLSDLARVYGRFGAVWRGLLLSLLERDLQPGVFQMDGICVAAAARRQGVGTALLKAIMAEAAASGMREVHLDVIDTNPRARALYERVGFVAMGDTGTGMFRPILGFRKSTRMRWSVGKGNAV